MCDPQKVPIATMDILMLLSYSLPRVLVAIGLYPRFLLYFDYSFSTLGLFPENFSTVHPLFDEAPLAAWGAPPTLPER